MESASRIRPRRLAPRRGERRCRANRGRRSREESLLTHKERQGRRISLVQIALVAAASPDGYGVVVRSTLSRTCRYFSSNDHTLKVVSSAWSGDSAGLSGGASTLRLSARHDRSDAEERATPFDGDDPATDHGRRGGLMDCPAAAGTGWPSSPVWLMASGDGETCPEMVVLPGSSRARTSVSRTGFVGVPGHGRGADASAGERLRGRRSQRAGGRGGTRHAGRSGVHLPSASHRRADRSRRENAPRARSGARRGARPGQPPSTRPPHDLRWPQRAARLNIAAAPRRTIWWPPAARTVATRHTPPRSSSPSPIEGPGFPTGRGRGPRG